MMLLALLLILLLPPPLVLVWHSGIRGKHPDGIQLHNQLHRFLLNGLSP